MRFFRHLFAILFITATLIGALHEIIHDHHHDSVSSETCPLYLLSQTPGILNDSVAILSNDLTDVPLFNVVTARVIFTPISFKNRSPPLSLSIRL